MHFEFFPSTTTPLDYAVLAKRAVPIILLVLFWCWETWRPFFGQQERRMRPHVLQSVMSMGQAIRTDLDPKVRELAYLKVVQLLDCRY